MSDYLNKPPRLAMSLEDMPRQRIHLVKDLPPRPGNLRVHCDYDGEELPRQHRPVGMPRKMYYLCTVEWSWSPMNSRIDAYYLNWRRPHWLLWIHDADPFADDTVPRTRVYAWARGRSAEAHEAAVYLLMDAWRAEAADDALDHFHMIDSAGLLRVEDLMAIGRAIWKSGSDEDLDDTETANDDD